jgi:hypothetical protein
MSKFAAIFGKMENGCDLAAKYLQFYSFQKAVSLSYGRKKVIEEILSISYNQSQCFTDKICCLKKYLIGQERRSI